MWAPTREFWYIPLQKGFTAVTFGGSFWGQKDVKKNARYLVVFHSFPMTLSFDHQS
jgi:hypothetical protein